MLAAPDDWGEVAEVEYDDRCRRLRLRDRRPRRAWPGTVNAGTVEALLNTPARAIDAFRTVAFWHDESRNLLAAGARGSTGPIPIWVAPPDTRVADLALGFDDVLYVAIQGWRRRHPSARPSGCTIRAAAGAIRSSRRRR